MSNKETQTAGSPPTHIAYQVLENGKKGYWTRIGAAWAHKDSKGFNIVLQSLPLYGRISLRLASETDA
jgi:hypothetical protein